AARQTGTALGIAVLGSLLSARAAAGVAADIKNTTGTDAPTLATAIVAHHGQAPASLPLPATTVHRYFTEAFADGLRLSLLVAGAATLAVTAAVARFLRSRSAPAVSTPPPAGSETPDRTRRL
ncbi:hypothetical protein AB0D04_26085, partial [Streptomyces sp. NPDC048483]